MKKRSLWEDSYKILGKTLRCEVANVFLPKYMSFRHAVDITKFCSYIICGLTFCQESNASISDFTSKIEAQKI